MIVDENMVLWNLQQAGFRKGSADSIYIKVSEVYVDDIVKLEICKRHAE
jgi:hypothetical protein